jgi:hypothetical protein
MHRVIAGEQKNKELIQKPRLVARKGVGWTEGLSSLSYFGYIETLFTLYKIRRNHLHINYNVEFMQHLRFY